MGILPTPDPTVGSCMSEEDKDVAIQLMRLGEISNISHGRTSASTFSGRADAASSTGATSDVDSDSEDEVPATRQQGFGPSAPRGFFKHPRKRPHPPCKTARMPSTGQPAVPHESVEVSGDGDDSEDGLAPGLMAAPKLKNPKPKATGAGSNATATQGNAAKSRPPQAASKAKPPKPSKPKAKKPSISGPMSPTSLPASRKPSITSTAAFAVGPVDDEQPDLSTKPRCQRCRKSKKGCDRQRPCGRCRDAGIPAEQCISEDEGNGRKGRYGRHMGVPIKKEEAPATHTLLPAAPIAAAPSVAGSDKSKKRKR